MSFQDFEQVPKMLILNVTFLIFYGYEELQDFCRSIDYF